MNKKIEVNDLMQTGYIYFLTEKEGQNFHPDFLPHLSPREMLEIGVFGGKYMTDCEKEFPVVWFLQAKLCHEKHEASLNFFKINASQPLKVWRLKGWLHPDDPRGWFQWYNRYYMGRRHEDDLRQVKRWKAFTRHWAAVKIHCHKGDYDCRPKQRQALLHWAYDSRQL